MPATNATPSQPHPGGDTTHWVHPPAEPRLRRRQIPDTPRRAFLAVMGSAAVATAFKANIAADALLTERSQYRVTTPDNDENKVAADRFRGRTWYLLGGFRVSYRDAARKLAALQPAMNTRAPASYIGYSNEGIDIAQLFIAIQRDAYARKIDTVYFYGDSFGGMAAVVLASLLVQNGITVKVIVMGSTPSSVRDILDPGKEYITLAGRVVPYLGLVGRLGAGVASGLANPNGQGMYQAARSGINNSLNPENNSLILSTTQATFLQTFPAQFDGRIPSSTGLGLMYDPDDFIVNARQAMVGWKALLPKNPTIEYELPHTGHASPEIHPDVYRSGLEVVLDKLDPPPLTSQPVQPIF
ncbi:hypothetical protein [Specibacter sp. RAF43]|uniref:hypothetical protein n=1 Tax=Specibacter sp. RAF43 TaxID=3233057 RepID=UPI003F9E6BC8